MDTKKKVQNELKKIHKRINRQADEEFQREKKELIAFYKVSWMISLCNV